MSGKFKAFIWLCVLFLLIGGFGCSEVALMSDGSPVMSTVRLDELDVTKAYAGWGKSQANKSVDGRLLRINGQSFEHGIGTHAVGQFNIKLDKGSKRFTAMVGIDDEVKSSSASVEFIVYGDGRILWQSGLMKAQESAKIVDVELKGIKQMKLVVSDGGDGIDYDHADWADAKFEVVGKKPVAVDPDLPKPYILTPKPGPKPRITGSKVFGARPGSPFLFTVTATGSRPVTFSAEGLPAGLALDRSSGRITGVVNESGEYKVKLSATNKLGKAQRDFRIVIGDTICLTPPMGWNSWNCWACAVDDQKVRATAKAMVDTGLINHGWTYINIDDCWMVKPGSSDPLTGGSARDDSGMLVSNKKFPDMKALTDYIHQLGLKAGTYISPGPKTCAGFEGSYGHEAEDAARFAEWGFDYLKYDWCSYSQIAKGNSLETLMKPYNVMREHLEKQPRDIVFSLCQYGMGNVWEWGRQVGGNCWRTTGDITDTWDSMAGIGFSQDKCSPYAGPGHWNDPDMLVVGRVGWGPNLHPSKLTPDEQYTHISLWCLLSSPLLIGCPIEDIDDFTLSLLTNDEVLDVNQDPLGKQAARITLEGDMQVWAKEMQDGSKAVGLFNLNALDRKRVTVEWSQLAIEGKHRVRDLWRQKDIGVFDGRFSATVEPHGVVLVKIMK